MVMNRKKIETLRSIASEKILKVMDALRIDYRERYQYVTAACPVHNGDRDDAWSWHLDKEIWQCFSRGCHDNFSKDVFGLVMGVLDCSFPDACKFVEKVVEGAGVNVDEAAHLNANKQFVRRAKKESIIYAEDALEKLLYHPYLEGRNYPKDLIQSYQIGVTSEGYKQMSNRLIVPVRNMYSQIVGFTGRTLFPNWKENKIPKWVHSKGFIGAENLFNIDRAAPHIRDCGEAILVEGPLDVLRLEHAGIHNGVAIFGRRLHNGQIALLAKCGTQKLKVALDADTAGKSGAETAFNTAKAFFKVTIVDLQSGDVGDLTVEKAREIFA
jgi:DNA primase